MSYSTKAAAGIGWMFTSSASTQGVGLLANMILARLLIPSDFGAVALVMALISILQTFAEVGMAVALIQREQVNKLLIDSAFSATACLTLSIVAILWASSSFIAGFFEFPVLLGLLKIAAISYFFNGIFSLYRCLLLRDLRYKDISIVGFGNVILSSSVSIFLAYRGYGPYSIVWGSLLAGAGVLTAGLLLTKYIPHSLGSFREMRSLFSFGIWVSVGRIMGDAAGKVDAFVIGKVLDAATLGGYYMAQKIVLLIPATFTGIIDQVMFPIYSKFQKDKERVKEGYFKTLSLSATVLLPPICLIFTFADPLVRIMLGKQWLYITPLVMIMSIFGIFQAIGGGIFASVIYSLGRPQLATLVNAFRMAALPVFVIVGSKWGVFGVAWGFALYGVFGRLFNQWLLKYFFDFSLIKYFKSIFPAALSSAIATLPAYLISSILAKGSLWSMISWNIAALILWGLLYLIILRIFAKRDMAYFFEIGIPILQKTAAYSFFLRIQKKCGFSCG